MEEWRCHRGLSVVCVAHLKQVLADADKGELHFWRNGKKCELKFLDARLKERKLYPAITIYYVSDQITLRGFAKGKKYVKPLLRTYSAPM
jgi:hypothetical protein